MTSEPAGVFVLVEGVMKPGRRPEALAWWEANLPDTRGKDGCREAYVYLDQDDPDRAIVFERWDTRAQHEEYARWRQQQPSRGEFADLLAQPLVVRYLDATDA